MSRVKRGVFSKKKHKKILKQAKGYYGSRSRTFKSAKQAVIKSHQYSYKDRRQKKRVMRKNWILKINAASRKNNISYSNFIFKLKKSGIILNRKTLSDIITKNYYLFESIIKKIQQ